MAVRSTFLKASVALLATVSVRATPFTLQSRGTIASDEIVGFPQTVPSGTVGDVYLAYAPYLKVVNGCVPFPAVDAEGDTKSVSLFMNERRNVLMQHSAGLKPTGASDGGCSSNTGQVYVRGTTYGDYYALMYAW